MADTLKEEQISQTNHRIRQVIKAIQSQDWSKIEQAIGQYGHCVHEIMCSN